MYEYIGQSEMIKQKKNKKVMRQENLQAFFRVVPQSL